MASRSEPSVTISLDVASRSFRAAGRHSIRTPAGLPGRPGGARHRSQRWFRAEGQDGGIAEAAAYHAGNGRWLTCDQVVQRFGRISLTITAKLSTGIAEDRGSVHEP